MDEHGPQVSFDQAKYWIDRHEQLTGDPRSVGNLGRSLDDNIAIEQTAVATARILARMLEVPRSILDLGCGYGRTAGPFIEQGYEYFGVDVSQAAVGDLRILNPDRQFGIVAALYVFVHFVDQEEWREVLARALTWVAPSGVLLLAEDLSDETCHPAPHVVRRTFAMYTEVLGEHGFAFDETFRRRFLRRDIRGSAYWVARHVAA
jgi:SAM-dependent methyltransferase